MKYKNWPETTWNKLKQALHEEKSTTAARPIAAFDADGTLWHTDLGENFFRYQLSSCELPDLPPQPWQHYVEQKSQSDPRPAYLWLAQINAGQSLSQVKTWAEQAIQQYEHLPIFPDQKRWIDELLAEGVEIYIVTASVKWAVEPGASQLGIPADHVLGIETTVRDGRVTPEMHGHMTYRQGKAEALLHQTGGRRPFFVAGNTLGDLSLLELATRIPMAVSTAPENQTAELVESERQLQAEAKKRSWLIHQF